MLRRRNNNILDLHSIFKLMNVKGVGPSLTNKVLFGITGMNITINEAVDSAEAKLQYWLSNDQIKQLISSDNEEIIQQVDDAYEKNNVQYLKIIDVNYPYKLKETLKNSAPPVLSCIGNIDLLKKKGVGFCGSRKASDRGLSVAEDFVNQLVDNDITIISGYASGIDYKTHYTALENNGTTIIILPEGILHFRIKKELKRVWDWNRVLVISQYLPNDKWTSSRAMLRNDTIIALSDAMVLIEAGETGGSMDAGKKTLKFRKPLFAPIYEGMPESATGNDILHKMGASPVLKARETGRANLSKLFNFLGI